MDSKASAALHGILGLCQRAGKIQLGTDMALLSVKGGKAFLALLDEGASENTAKKAADACSFYHVPLVQLPEGLLDSACGRDGRMLGAVCDAGFAAKITSICAEQQEL